MWHHNGTEWRVLLPLWKEEEDAICATESIARMPLKELFRNGRKTWEKLPLWGGGGTRTGKGREETRKEREEERREGEREEKGARRQRGNTRKETARTTGKRTGASGIVLPLGDVGSRKGRGPTKWGGSPRGNTIPGA